MEHNKLEHLLERQRSWTAETINMCELRITINAIFGCLALGDAMYQATGRRKATRGTAAWLAQREAMIAHLDWAIPWCEAMGDARLAQQCVEIRDSARQRFVTHRA